MSINPIRGEIWWANLTGNKGSEQGGERPMLIIQNDIGNQFSPTVIVAIIGRTKRTDLPVHVVLNTKAYGLPKESSVVMLEQLRTLDKSRLICRSGQLNEEDMRLVDQALMVSLGVSI